MTADQRRTMLAMGACGLPLERGADGRWHVGAPALAAEIRTVLALDRAGWVERCHIHEDPRRDARRLSAQGRLLLTRWRLGGRA